MYESEFDRIPKDRYWSEPWLTQVLLRHLDVGSSVVWEPCAGRGDMVKVLQDNGIQVIASDIDMHEFDAGECPAKQVDFFSTDAIDWARGLGYKAIITNPPYDKAEECLRYALSSEAEIVAMLLRSEFNQAGGRAELFSDPKYMFAFEIVLTTRPRWDWWFRDKPISSPRHGFSWFAWDKGQFEFRPTQYFEGKEVA